MRRFLRPRVLIPAGFALVVVIGIAAYLTQPWRLFINTEVVEAAPSSAVDTVLLEEGTFVDHDHGTSGNVRILALDDGSRVLRLEGLRTSNGPDLEVWLSDQPVLAGPEGWSIFDDGAYVNLGPLKGNIGTQAYDLPADVDLGAVPTVVIWCERFSRAFGSATLA